MYGTHDADGHAMLANPFHVIIMAGEAKSDTVRKGCTSVRQGWGTEEFVKGPLTSRPTSNHKCIISVLASYWTYAEGKPLVVTQLNGTVQVQLFALVTQRRTKGPVLVST